MNAPTLPFGSCTCVMICFTFAMIAGSSFVAAPNFDVAPSMSAWASVRTLLASNNTSLGRFRRDSTLLTEVADIRSELSKVQALLDEPRGTAGRVMHDTALTVALGDVQREMSLLFADIKAHPFKYLSF